MFKELLGYIKRFILDSPEIEQDLFGFATDDELVKILWHGQSLSSINDLFVSAENSATGYLLQVEKGTWFKKHGGKYWEFQADE